MKLPLLPPDPNQRQCVDCKGTFNPYSMRDSMLLRPPVITQPLSVEPGVKREILFLAKPVLPPTDYQCITCRSKVPA